jgi:cell division protein FtsL
MPEETVRTNDAEQKKEAAPRLKYSVFLFVAFILMVVAITYVWSHIQMTRLEYQIAEEMTRKEHSLDEQKKLRVEFATLKSPQRIETVAKNSLQMSYPERDQVILIRGSEVTK